MVRQYFGRSLKSPATWILIAVMTSHLIGYFHGRIIMVRDCRATGYHELMNHYFVCDVWWDKEEMKGSQEEQEPEEIYMEYN